MTLGPMPADWIGRTKRLASRLIIPRTSPEAAAPYAWSIGIYTGSSPVRLRNPRGIRNPVLTPADVTDVTAETVADPFMLRRPDAWYMFFEVFNTQAARGEIGLAMSGNGFDWMYRGIVLAEPFHLSYPYVFEHRNESYMIPESHEAADIRLYKAASFPTGWTLVNTLLEGGYFVDTSVFQHDGTWWMFTETNHESKHDQLRLFHAPDLAGPWQEHEKSPIVDGDAHIARPAGRVVSINGSLIRYAQDDYPTYGRQVRAFEITELTKTRYAERLRTPRPIVGATGSGWNSSGMHHIDPHQIGDRKWIACVDGLGVCRMPVS